MRRMAWLGLALFVAACGGDDTPPPAPIIDPVASPTAATKILITGTAEFGATIEITGAAAVEPAEIVANPFTAEFRAYVTLNENTVNTLTFVAIDAAGNRSEPATVTVEHVAGFGVGLVSIENLHVNGQACVIMGEPLACVVSPGDLIEFDVATTYIDAKQLGYSAWFQQADQLETLSLFVPADATSPVIRFRFTVPSGLFEDVPLVAHAVDGSGNEYTSASYLLRVSIDAGDRAIALIAEKGLVNGPNDVGVDAAGDVYIANDGDGNLLQIAAGSTFPTVFSSYNGNSSYLAVAGNGDVYVTDNDVFRVSANGLTVDQYANNAPGAARGAAVVPATRAKAVVDATGAADGASIKVGAITYELDNNASCTATATHVCVDTSGGGNLNATLATAINASTEVDAAHDTINNEIVIAAAQAGEAGNNLALVDNGVPITAGFEGGHAEELFVGADGDKFVFRLPEDLTGLPVDIAAANHGVFDVLQPQRGIAVNYTSTASSYDVFGAHIYFIDNGNRDTVIGNHQLTDFVLNGTEIFNTNHNGQFDTLYDVALAPNGCLLVSDEATGDIWSIDVRDPADATPTISLVARGFDQPRGLAFSGTDLYVTDRGFDAVVKISASPTAACF